MDESMDVAGLEILIVFVRYQYLESFQEDLLLCKPLPTNTSGAEIFKLIDEIFKLIDEIFFSRGKTLTRLFEMKPEVRIFLIDDDFALGDRLCEKRWLMKLAYLADIFKKTK